MYFMNDAAMEVSGRITDRTVHRLVYPAGGDVGGRARFTVHRWPVEPSVDVAKLADECERAAARGLPGYRPLGRSHREVSGLPLALVGFAWADEGEDLYAREAHLVVRGVWLRFTAAGRLEARDVCDQAIERAIATFRVRA